jgi:hypothetical protein
MAIAISVVSQSITDIASCFSVALEVSVFEGDYLDASA